MAAAKEKRKEKEKANALEDVALIAGTQHNLSNLYSLDIYGFNLYSTSLFIVDQCPFHHIWSRFHRLILQVSVWFMVDLYSGLFTVNECLPVVTIWPMSASMKVCFDQCLLWWRSASTKVCFNEGQLRRRSPSMKACFNQCLLWQRSASINVSLTHTSRQGLGRYFRVKPRSGLHLERIQQILD